MPLRICHAGDLHLDEDRCFTDSARFLKCHRDGKSTGIVPERRMKRQLSWTTLDSYLRACYCGWRSDIK
jgi:hypothetical protein